MADEANDSTQHWAHHEHRCGHCGRLRECDNPFCSYAEAFKDICKDCLGAKMMRHFAAPLRLLDSLCEEAPDG
jgi:hypothetical protein